MNSEVLKKIQSKMMKKSVPVIKPGYTVEIDTYIKEGNKQRTQKFKGLVISVTGSGTDKMVTVRKISKGYAVEKKLPIYSPNVGAIKVIKMEEVRRSKLFFMRKRVGKSSMRIKKGKSQFVTDDDLEFVDMFREEVTPEDVVAVQPTSVAVEPEAIDNAETAPIVEDQK